MGCNESRSSEEEAERGGESTAFLEDVTEAQCPLGVGETMSDCSSLLPPPVETQILDFAQKMSEDVLAQALQLCWQVEARHKDLPFIDDESDYLI